MHTDGPLLHSAQQRFHPKVRQEIYPLTGVRALAALWVILYHLREKIKLAFPVFSIFIDPVISIGHLGVDLFFILSGFIIYYNYAQRFAIFRISTYVEFLWMRLARLWPVHLAILLMYVALLLYANHTGIPLKHPEYYSLGKLFQNLILVHAWSFPMTFSWNVPAWSISCEWWAYILFPVIILSNLVTRSARISIMTGSASLLITMLTLQAMHDSSGDNLIHIFGEFVAGCCLCNLFHCKVGHSWNWDLIISISVASVVLLPNFIFPIYSLIDFWCVPFLALIVLGLAYHRCAYSRILSTRPFLFGGYISYSMYMVHLLCFVILEKLAPKVKDSALLILANLTFVIVTAIIMFYFVEEPCRKAMRKSFPRHKQQPYPVI